jgi:hypothetical protein
MNIELYVTKLAEEAMKAVKSTDPRDALSLEEVLKGLAVELWTDASGERFWLVADEADAALLGEPRGSIYTTSEARLVVRVGDPETVAAIHHYKQIGGIVRGYITEGTSQREIPFTERAGETRRTQACPESG